MKLVLIMVLLILSLMTVVGAFLINSVASFYLNSFYTQMQEVFADQDLYYDLVTPTEGEADGSAALDRVLTASAGALGVDGRNRNYYILDGKTGRFLAGSDPEGGGFLTKTPNLLTALTHGEIGSRSDITAQYMDVAVPIQRAGQNYIIYLYDNRAEDQSLNSRLLILILQSLSFGLIISVLLSFLLSKTMIGPIEQLTAGARRMAEGSFSEKLQVGSKDEIGVLTNTFNNMAHQLQDTLQAVEEERNKLDTLFLRMTDGVVAFSSDGTVIHSNPAAAEMLGWAISTEDTYHTLFGDVAPLSSVLSLSPPEFLEGERVSGGRSLEIFLAPLAQSGLGGVLVLIHDVTTQRKNEELRREFVANVSHELRTPLTNIRSYAETISENVGELPPEMEKNFLNVILGESDRMTHIVQDLLTLSRFDSGRSPIHLTTFPFGTALRDLYNAVLLEAQRHGHRLTLDIPERLPAITADRERILQVMMNVVSNAVKYTPDGGRITISAGQTGSRVWMEVADNGIGIPPEDRDRIFERFYRVDKARSRESGGTGLGLSIAKEIVDQHQGFIGLVDKQEPGLTIRIELPVEGPGYE